MRAFVDPRLLEVFVVVHGERSATRAAERLGVSQPAVSASLRELREVFGDPLFVKDRRRLVPTPRADALLPRSTLCWRSCATSRGRRISCRPLPKEP